MEANTKKLFELFRKKGVSRKGFKETVGNWTTFQIGDFLEQCEGIAPYVKSTDLGSHKFDFAASSTLSGGCYPCIHPDCRLKQVDRVARFAALYANHVLIINPLPAHTPAVVDQDFRLRLWGDLQVLNHVRPLLEAGIVGLSPNYFALCDHHFVQLRHAERKLRREASKVLSSHLKHISIKLSQKDDYVFVQFEGPEKIFEHGSGAIIVKGTLAGVKRQGKLRLVVDYIDGTLSDVLRQNVRGGLSYITGRDLDLDLIQASNKSDVDRRNQALLRAFAHSLPFIERTDIQNLVNVRKAEAEAFGVYRDSLSAALNTASNAKLKDYPQVFNDEVLPQLHIIDLAIKNSRKLLTRSVATDLGIGAGLVGVGLLSGILPPTMGNVATVVGGYSFVKGLAQHVCQLTSEPLTIRDNKYYFLWKLRKKTSDS
jgi:hypothetical protein